MHRQLLEGDEAAHVFTSWQLLTVATLYVGSLFVIAWFADRRERHRVARPRPWVYGLALAVYCTAWTFYGAVGRASADGLSYLPIYLGPALVFLFGAPLLRRLIQVCKSAQLTSVADFIGARYGNDPMLAAGVTLIALTAGLPYLALQLRAISLGFDVLTVDGGTMGEGLHSVTIITMLLAGFTMLFGTRHVASTESHHGLVTAVATESVLKLIAFVAVGVFALWHLGGLSAGIQSVARLPSMDLAAFGAWSFWLQTILAGAAVIVLPRQFHLMVVEHNGGNEFNRARWLFPTYLLIFAAFVLPLAAAGERFVGAANADRYVLALPQALGNPSITLLAFLGGFSAATGMVIVSCVALSTMLSNEITLPALLRGKGYQRAEQDLGALLLRVRRLTIVGLLLAAWLIDRLMLTHLPLAMIGLLSFSAIAHLAPPVFAGVLWSRSNRRGAIAGLVGGTAMWAATTLLPSLYPDVVPSLSAEEILMRGTLISFATHITLHVLGSLLSAPSLTEQVHTARLMGFHIPEADAPRPAGGISVSDLVVLLERFFGTERTRALLSEYGNEQQSTWRMRGAADATFIRFCEGCLASALGASSARVLIERLRTPGTGEVIDIIEQTSRAVRFNRDLLHATLDHMDQGVSVIDGELRLIAWNDAYTQLFHFPDDLLREGTPVEQLVRHNAKAGLMGQGDTETLVQRRLTHLRRGTPYRHERTMPSGRVLEITGNPMPGGGFVTTFSDVTAYKRAEAMLQQVNEELEERVAERTRALVDTNQALRSENRARAEAEAEARRARADAERANRSKTRFLAATTHDMAQPLNAARLFNHTIEQASEPAVQAAAHNVSRSLASIEQMLEGLSDISRLDSGAQRVNWRTVSIGPVLEELAAESSAIAQERGLRMRLRTCNATIHTDDVLLRRIIRNLLTNALRYTQRGGVLLGCRCRHDHVVIEVYDTGPGIPADKRREIFEEFKQLNPRQADGERGLGLGLAISERMATLLGHTLSVDSTPGRGSVFRLVVARTTDAAAPAEAGPAAATSSTHGLEGTRVLCLDNDAHTLAATRALLERWGCVVATAHDAQEAMRAAPMAPDALMIDYHLDEGTGIDAHAMLCAQWGSHPPTVLITADRSMEARGAAAAAQVHFLAKPVKPAALRALLSRMLPRRPRPHAADAPEDAQQ